MNGSQGVAADRVAMWHCYNVTMQCKTILIPSVKVSSFARFKGSGFVSTTTKCRSLFLELYGDRYLVRFTISRIQ